MDAIPDSEIEFREQLIQEREGEIEEIEQGITELNQIFKDLAVMVGEQGTLIGRLSEAASEQDVTLTFSSRQYLLECFKRRR